MTRISKTIVAGVSALAMASAVVLPATPASAGGFRGGGGGFHDGGFHGGGFHGGGWGGGGWHGGG
jgi:Spy/CpxP family protein refolding chaperone